MLGAGPRKQNAWVPVSLICVTLGRFSTQPQASISLALKGAVATRANEFYLLS